MRLASAQHSSALVAAGEPRQSGSPFSIHTPVAPLQTAYASASAQHSSALVAAGEPRQSGSPFSIHTPVAPLQTAYASGLGSTLFCACCSRRAAPVGLA